MMFGDSEIFLEVAAELLSDFSLEEILELNNMTEEEALAYLIENGYVEYPTSYFRRIEGESEEA